MKQGQRLWARDELILAINLYCQLPFGRMHRQNPEVVRLASLLHRTPGSVAFKLVNFASLDPNLKARGIKGAVNISKLDQEVWNEFAHNWDTLPYESEQLRAQLMHQTVEQLHNIPEETLPQEGKERVQIIKARINQSFFRSAILAAYNNTCCITGIQQPELLIAGHIRPWGIDEKNRLNPSNGIAINALHDKAFEIGLITITPDYRIKIAPELLKDKHEQIPDYFARYEDQPIHLPSRFLPDIEFLKYHNQERFNFKAAKHLSKS